MNCVIYLVSFCLPSTHPVFISQIGTSAYKCKKLIPYKPLIKITCMCTCICVCMCVHGTQHKEECGLEKNSSPFKKGVNGLQPKRSHNLDTETQHFMKNLDMNVCACVFKKHRHSNMVIHDLCDLSSNQKWYVHWFTYCNLVADAPSSAQNIIYWRKHRKSRVLFFFLLLICI